MMGITELYILRPGWMTLTFIQGYSYLRNRKTTVTLFLNIAQSIWMKVGLLKHMLHLFHMINIQGRELYWHDFMNYTFNIGLHWDTC